MKKTIIVACLAVATSVALIGTASANRCPAGSHWDEWMKVCRPIR